MKKKIVLVNDFEFGGGAEVVFRATFDLLNEDVDFIKYTGHATPKMASNPFSYLFNRHQFNDISKLLHDFKPDIIHIHNFYHFISPSILYAVRRYRKKGFTLKVILTAHDFHLIYPNSGFYYFKQQDNNPIKVKSKSIWIRLIPRIDHRGHIHSILKKIQWFLAYKLKKLHTEIDVIISPSNFLIKTFKGYFKNVYQYFLIRNPVILLGEKKITKLSLESNRINLIFLGRLSFEKGLSNFIKSLANLNDIDFKFDIYGEGDIKYEQYLQTLIMKYQLEKKVFLKGLVKHEDVKNIVPKYDALVLPSIWYENAPLSLIEASFEGLYVITSEDGGTEELAKLCMWYHLINPQNLTSVNNAIRKTYDTLKDKKLESNLIILNQEKLKSIFSQNKYKQDLLNLYQTI